MMTVNHDTRPTLPRIVRRAGSLKRQGRLRAGSLKRQGRLSGIASGESLGCAVSEGFPKL